MILAQEQDLEYDEAPADPKSAESERFCVVTREAMEPEKLIRFVRAPDGAVVPDLKRKLPGRGVWVGLSRELVAQAVKKQLFSRGFRDKALASPDLPDLVEKLLYRDALQGLAIANKAGLVVQGFAKVEAGVASGALSALVHASDGAADGKRKLRQAMRRRFPAGAPPEFEFFASADLDSALGRGNVVHLLVGAGAASKVFLASARRYALYRGGGEGAAGSGSGEDAEA